MDPEDFAPRPNPQLSASVTVPARELSRLSVHDLTDYIAALEAEIRRARSAIEAKQAHRATADALFRKP